MLPAGMLRRGDTLVGDKIEAVTWVSQGAEWRLLKLQMPSGLWMSFADEEGLG